MIGTSLIPTQSSDELSGISRIFDSSKFLWSSFNESRGTTSEITFLDSTLIKLVSDTSLLLSSVSEKSSSEELESDSSFCW